MKYLFLIAILISLASSGAPASSAPMQRDRITEITLERTRCFGVCPVYKITLRRDGTVTYMGIDFVERKGEHQGTIGQQTFDRLAGLIESQGFFKLKDSYSKPVTDMPSVIISVARGDRRKTVSNYADAGPVELWGLEQAVEAVVARVEWKKAKTVTLEPGQITEISLERTRCFGTCPVYKVVLRRDGAAAYIGEDHVRMKGRYQGKVSLYDFDQLAKLIEAQGFFDLEGSYTKPVTDMPSAIVTVTRGEQQKRVSNYASAGPAKLWGIEMAIDAVVSQIEWKKSG